MEKPEYLYHGSSHKVERLSPHQAYDGLDDRGTAFGVFATSLREFALVFALGCIPDDQGNVTRYVAGLNPCRVVFLEGQPNRGGIGYLYTVLATQFTPIDAFQWLSTDPVTPVACEEIVVDEYLWLVQELSDAEREAELQALKERRNEEQP